MLARAFPLDHFTVPRSSAPARSPDLALSVTLGNPGKPLRGILAGAMLHRHVEPPDARRLLDGMRDRDAVLWTYMLSAYATTSQPSPVGMMQPYWYSG
jgi:hypothetical protein